MVAVSVYYLASLVAEIGGEPFVFLIKAAPDRQLGLQIDAEVIGCLETSLWRTPRMKSHMIDAILLASAKILVPFVITHRNVGCEWKYAGVMLASQECLASVDGEMCAVAFEVTKGECRLFFVGLAVTFHSHLNAAEILRREFTPFQCVFTEVVCII